MVKYTNEELLDVLSPSLRESKELTTKQKVVLGQLVIYNGLDVVKKDGYFFRSNKDLKDDCGIEEKTLITAVNKLVMLGFIDRKSGSRKDGASLYRVNQKMITDYCRTPVNDNCKKEIEDYSKQIAAMSDRIKELEVTVKRLVEKITVIEGRNYSTESDKEIEIDKEKDINNISLYNTNNNIIGEAEKSKELKKETSGENLSESQFVVTASSPIEELSQASSVTYSTTIEDTPTSTEDEQYRQWLQVLNPYLKEIEDATTLGQMKEIKERLSRTLNDYYDSHEDTSPTVADKIEKIGISALNTKLRYLKEKLCTHTIELSEYLKRQHNYGTQ